MDKKAGDPKPTDTTPPLASAKKRVDYLAGLVALSSLLVAGIHFALTFVSASINPGAYMHYKSEIWARKTVTLYLLNLIWIGPFLMTSSRFLAASYLRNGKLEPMAEKTVGRTPRRIIPIVAIGNACIFLYRRRCDKVVDVSPIHHVVHLAIYRRLRQFGRLHQRDHRIDVFDPPRCTAYRIQLLYRRALDHPRAAAGLLVGPPQCHRNP